MVLLEMAALKQPFLAAWIPTGVSWMLGASLLPGSDENKTADLQRAGTPSAVA
jgi:hypothetical protein